MQDKEFVTILLVHQVRCTRNQMKQRGWAKIKLFSSEEQEVGVAFPCGKFISEENLLFSLLPYLGPWLLFSRIGLPHFGFSILH